jgi:hypothetical protein
MSAWIVSKAHIDAIVTAALKDEMVRLPHDTFHPQKMSTDEMGQMLWRENYKSVNHRYNERARCPSYRFNLRACPLTSVEVFKAIHCLEYQSCEHPGWKRSKARSFLRELESSLTRCLPGYAAAPWGIDS